MNNNINGIQQRYSIQRRGAELNSEAQRNQETRRKGMQFSAPLFDTLRLCVNPVYQSGFPR
jgi:hypothetical protein